jgi:hypothetical protein
MDEVRTAAIEKEGGESPEQKTRPRISNNEIHFVESQKGFDVRSTKVAFD